MSAEVETEESRYGSNGPSKRRPRILIEGTKLADEKMDGIRRYVSELLLAYDDMGLDEEFDLDVMIHDQVYPLADVIKRLKSPGQPGIDQAPEAGISKSVVMMIPPIFQHLIKWLIPDWVSRRFLGKGKSSLAVPAIEMTTRSLIFAILPPFLFVWLQRVVPESFVHVLWEWGWLKPEPKSVDAEPYDLVHFTLPNNHHFLRPSSTSELVTIHDLCHIACPEFQTRANSATMKHGLDAAVAGGAGFVCVSKATERQLVKQYDLSEDRVCTVHNGCRAEYFRPVTDTGKQAQVLQKYKLPTTPYLLALSTIEPRKNLGRTIQAFELAVKNPLLSGMHLVLAGNQGWKSTAVMSAAEESPCIHLSGYVEDEDLATIFSAAKGFVYVSHYEGFGLPLLESMHCGTPVIYGDNSSMPEIVADAGLAADANDVQSIARQIEHLVSEQGLAESLGQKALERAGEFSWKKTALMTAQAYRDRLN